MKTKWYEKVYMGLFGYVCFLIGIMLVFFGLGQIWDGGNAYGGIIFILVGFACLYGVKGMADDYAKDGEK